MDARTAIAPAAALSVLVCCAGEEQFVALPALDSSIQSILLVERHRDEPVVITALTREELESDPVRIKGDITDVFLAAYASSLADLGFPKGAVTVAAVEGCAQRSITPADHLFHWDVETPNDGLAEVSSLPADLSSLTLQAVCPCRDLVLERHDLVGVGSVALLFELDAGRIGVIAQNGAFELSPGFEIVASSSVSGSVVSAYRAVDGTVRVGATEGRILVRRTSGALEQLAETGEGGTIDSIHGAPAGYEDETLLASANASIWALTGSTVSQIDVPRTTGTTQIARVLWTRPGHFWASVRQSSGLVELTRQSDSSWEAEEIVWNSSSDPVEELMYIESYGTLLSSRTRRLFVRADDATDWTEMTPRTDSVRTVIAFAGGMMTASRTGLLQHHPLSGFCDRELEPFDQPGFGPRTILPLSDGSLLIAGSVTDPEDGVLYRARER